jgi:hypothetical protein
MEKDYSGIVPRQYTGKEITVHASETLKDDAEAQEFFNISKERLLDANNWHKISTGLTAVFQVTDADGKAVYRQVAEGDHLQVDIPGPGSKEGEGFDWVRVEQVKEVVEENLHCIAFRVRPCENPKGNSESQNIAHFYDDSGTSNFIVIREGVKVTALVIDKNLKPNVDTDSFTDKIRGAILGTSALTVLSRIQWQNLVDGIVKK